MPVDTDITLEATINFFKDLGLATLIILASLLAARILRGIVRRFAQRRKLPIDITNLLLQISEIGILLLGVITALGTLGIDIAALIAGLGLVGFAVGFALRDLLSNFLSGLLIILYNPFVRGDRITVSGSEGIVSEVNLRYTVLQADGKKILIPNSSLFTNIVTVERKVPFDVV